jgi:hypothetical protein
MYVAGNSQVYQQEALLYSTAIAGARILLGHTTLGLV